MNSRRYELFINMFRCNDFKNALLEEFKENAGETLTRVFKQNMDETKGLSSDENNSKY